MSFDKIANLTPKDYEKPGEYLRDIDKDMTRLGLYLGKGITEDVATTFGLFTRTFHIRNGIIVGYTDV